MTKPQSTCQLLPYRDRRLSDLEGEIWKDIPGIEGYGMISNYGRVKRLAYETFDKNGKPLRYEERIQSQKITSYFNQFKQDKEGNLSARIQINGVCHSLSVGRIVYYCFVEKFDLSDKYIYISYKDYNRLNTTPDNLFKADHAGLQQHIIRAGRKDLHFGHSAENQELFTQMGRDVNIKKVSQYDMDGNYLATFESISAAAAAVGVSLAVISSAVDGRKNLTAGGYIWRFGQSRRKIAVKRIHEAKRANKGVPVSRYDLNGHKIKTYYNIARAANDIGALRRVLSDAVNGKILIYAGSIWRKGEKENIIVDKERRSLELRKGYTLSKYGPDGKKIATFYSSKEAAQHAEVQTERINAMAIRDDLLLHGFIWRYGDAARLPKEEIKTIKENLGKEKARDITQYDLKRKRVGYFTSIKAAADATGTTFEAISACVNGHKATGGGFIWRRGKGTARLHLPETPYPLGYKLRQEVIQLDQERRQIRTFVSIKEASRATGIHCTTISAAIRGNINTAGGFGWKRLTTR